MFGFLKKVKTSGELDRMIAEIEMNMQNNYKDATRTRNRIGRGSKEYVDEKSLCEKLK